LAETVIRADVLEVTLPLAGLSENMPAPVAVEMDAEKGTA